MATRRKKPKEPEELGQPTAAAADPSHPNAELGQPGAAAPEDLTPNNLKAYDQALHDLDITVPVAACRLVGSRLEFRLYGGRVVYWPPAAGD